jgi:3-oxoadipate enol-lactonase/4-carboxymuconolactone decarboxylase
VAPQLADHFHLLAWDLPGHGASPPSADFTVADLAAALLAAVDGELDYAGVSLGGVVGLQLLLDAPERIGRAAVFSAGARIGEPDAWRARAERVRREGLAPLAAETPQRWFAPEHRSSPTALALVEELAGSDVDSYAAACEALAGFDVRVRLAEITAPVLAVAGVHDPVIPPAGLRHVADGVRYGRLAVLADVGHQAPAEAPAKVAELLLEHAQWRPVPTLQEDVRANGMRVRREVLGDTHVDRAGEAAHEFAADFQRFISTYAWGEIWTRPGLDRRSRSIITLTALVAGGHHEELALHLRAALRNGLTKEDVREVLLQTAVYCGVPSANTAFRIAQRIFEDDDS